MSDTLTDEDVCRKAEGLAALKLDVRHASRLFTLNGVAYRVSSIDMVGKVISRGDKFAFHMSCGTHIVEAVYNDEPVAIAVRNALIGAIESASS